MKEVMFKPVREGRSLINRVTRKIDRRIYLVGAGLILGLVFGFVMNFTSGVDFGFDEVDQRLMQVSVSNQNLETPEYLAKTLESTFQEIEYAVAVEPSKKSHTSWSRGVLSSTNGGNQLFASAHFIGEDFFKVFPYDFIQSAVFLDKKSIFISADIALRIFDTTIGIIGKTVSWKNDKNGGEYIVSGIFHPTSLIDTDQFEVLFAMEQYNTLLENKSFQPQTLNAYVMLKHGTDAQKFNNQIEGFINSKNAGMANNLFARGADTGYVHGWPSNPK